ncbi:glutathione S-transferase, partial [bacterium LRH843]|nr:glutathione S-transferase [bacterium LRH843]
VMRFKSYALPVSKRSQQYMQQIMQHPAVIQWVNAARAEAA